MRGKVRYKQPNGIKVEMYWKYNDYYRSYFIPTTFTWNICR